VVADKAHDKQALADRIGGMGAEAVIPTRKGRKAQRGIDREGYKDRNPAGRG
jgi:nitrous oxide reductase accessory protein NosL